MSRFLLGFELSWLTAKFIRSVERTKKGRTAGSQIGAQKTGGVVNENRLGLALSLERQKLARGLMP